MAPHDVRLSLIEQSYQQLDKRLDKVEFKIDTLGEDMKAGQTSLTKVIVGAVTTIAASCLSIVVVLLMN
jgi:hypothetical protein